MKMFDRFPKVRSFLCDDQNTSIQCVCEKQSIGSTNLYSGIQDI